MAVYKIIFKGEITNEGNRRKIEASLAKFFKIPVEKAATLFNGKPYALKQGLTLEVAEVMQQKFKNIGVVSHLIKEENITDEITSQSSDIPKNKMNLTCQDCGSKNITEKIENKEFVSTSSSERAENSIQWIGKVKEKWSIYLAWQKTPRAKNVVWAMAILGFTMQLSGGYLSDCSSGVSKSSVKKIIDRKMSKKYGSDNPDYELELTNIRQVSFNESSKTYLCQCQANFTYPTAEQEKIHVNYSVEKKFPAKSPKVTLLGT